MITKKGDGSQVKESTDSSTTIEDDDVKGMFLLQNKFLFFSKIYFHPLEFIYSRKHLCLIEI